jgi:hypothetical protein
MVELRDRESVSRAESRLPVIRHAFFEEPGLEIGRVSIEDCQGTC